MTPRQQLDRRKSAALSIGSDGLYEGSAKAASIGGNLADELADAWDEDGVDEPGSSFSEGLREGSDDPSTMHEEMCNGGEMSDAGLLTLGSPATPSRSPVLDHPWHSPTQRSGNVKVSPIKRHRRGDSRYGFSDHGNHSDVEETDGISSALAREMANIEGLARRELDDDSVSEAGGIITRTTAALRDLGAQASIESGVTRIITAFASITSHRTHKTREISSQAHSLLIDRAFTLSEDEIVNVIAEIDVLIQYAQLPAAPKSLRSLQELMANTTDLTRCLGSLTDILQESRQASSAASRRLKSVRDFVVELRQEEEAREEAIRYLERGDWDQRIGEREARRTCGDVVDGFETTCDMWRSRLFGTTAEATPA